MKKKFAIVGISVFMSAILLLSGCGGSSSGSDSAGSEPDNAANGSGEASSAQSEGEKLMANATARMGTVTVANGEGADRDDLTFISVIEPTSLEPGGLASSDSNFRVVATQIYETLVRETPMDRTQLQPMLAASWEFNEDNTQVTFKIKEGVKFHNGDTMTADDVAYSLNRAIGLATNADISEMLADAVVVDDTHVTLNLKYAYGPVLNILTNPNFAVVSQKYVEECEANGTNFGRNPMGTGAYKFVEWINGSSITLEALEEWNGGDVPIKNLTHTPDYGIYLVRNRG